MTDDDPRGWFARWWHAWRQPPWDLLPLRAQVAPYRAWMLAVIAASVATIAITAPRIVDTQVDPLLLAVATGCAALASLRLLRTTEEVAAALDGVLVLALVAAGHPVEAIAAGVAGCVVERVRTPLVLHLFLANVLVRIAAVAALFLVVEALAGTALAGDARWLGAVAAMLVAEYVIDLLALAVPTVLGGYANPRSAARDWIDDLRDRAVGVAPFVFLLAAVLSTGGDWAVLLLPAPLLLALQLDRRRDELVAVRRTSWIDPTTGLANRARGEQLLVEAISAGPSLAVALVAVRGLEDAVARHGVPVRDHVLASVARTIDAHMPSDVLAAARWADETFLVAIPAGADTRVLDAVRTACDEQLRPLGARIEVGVHDATGSGSARRAWRRAEQALRAAEVARDGIARIDGTDAMSADFAARRDPEWWLALADRALQEGDADGAARACYRAWWDGDPDDAQAREALERAAAGGDDVGWAWRARAARAVLDGAPERALEADAVALELARSCGDEVLEAAALAASAHTQELLGSWDAACSAARSALEHAERYGLESWRRDALLRLVRLLDASGRAREARELAASGDLQPEVGESLAIDHGVDGAAWRHEAAWIALVDAGDPWGAAARGGWRPLEDAAARLDAARACAWAGRVDEVRQLAAVAPAELRSPLAHARVAELRALRIAAEVGQVGAVMELAARWEEDGRARDAALTRLAAAGLARAAGDDRVADRVESATRRMLLEAGLASVAERLVAERIDDALDADRGMPAASGLLDVLDRDDAAKVRARLVPLTLARGSVLEPGAGVVQVESGLLRVVREVGNQRRVELIVGGGEAWAAPNDAAGAAPFVVEAMVPSELLVVDAADAEQLSIDVPAFARLLATQHAVAAARAHDRAMRIAWWSVDQRLAALLCELDDRFGHPTLDGGRIINVAIPQAELGELIGASRKAVAQSLADLRRAGVVSIDRRRVRIEQPDALRRRVGTASEGSSRAS